VGLKLCRGNTTPIGAIDTACRLALAFQLETFPINRANGERFSEHAPVTEVFDA